MPADRARLAAYNAVKRIDSGAYSNLISVFDRLSGADRAFAESIALGTAERMRTLEYVCRGFYRSEVKRETELLLFCGVYQLLFMDKIPDNAACDETVRIGAELFGRGVAGFINAVMRSVCREREAVYARINSAPRDIFYSADSGLYSLIEGQYGKDTTERIFASFMGGHECFVRVNGMRSDSEKVARMLDGKAVSETRVVCRNARKAVEMLETGDYIIQGPGSQSAVELLSAARGERIVDVCACPGGKTLGAAIDMHGKGEIYAFDIHENKLPLILAGAKRLGIDCIRAAKRDARTAEPALVGSADGVICDVPCSGTGVIGTKPEIKYKSPKDFSRLYAVQRDILLSAVSYLKPGGRLVYSTCSINKCENEDIVLSLTERSRDYTLVSQRTYLPFENGGEGFYTALIKKER